MANLYEDHARELLCLGPEYHLARWDSLDFEKVGENDPTERMRIAFAQAPLLASGEIAWKYEVKGSRRKVVFTRGGHQVWVDAWEARTGLCRNCLTGHPGQELESISATGGIKTRTCNRCKGTGKAPGVES